MGYVDTANYKFKKPEPANKFDVADLNNGLDAVDAALKKVDTGARKDLGDRMNGIDTRIDGVDTRIDGVSARTEEANTKIDNIEIITTWV